MKRKRKVGRISQGQNGESTTTDQYSTSLEGGNPHYDASRPKPPGRRGADKARKRKKKGNWRDINVGTYNTNKISRQEDLEHLLEELKSIKWDIVGLCETQRYGDLLDIFNLDKCNKQADRSARWYMDVRVQQNKVQHKSKRYCNSRQQKHDRLCRKV